jgi:hypothetical protein
MNGKLTLDIDALTVVSFGTTAAPEEPRGTVKGQALEMLATLSCGYTNCCQSVDTCTTKLC